MKPFLIATNLRGNAYQASFAIVEITAALVARISDARSTVNAYFDRHGSHGSLKDLSGIDIHFMKDAPEIPGFDDFLGDEPIIIEGIGIDTYTDAAEAQDLYVRSECTGLMIGQDSIFVTGFERHLDNRLESDDILPLILDLLRSHQETASASPTPFHPDDQQLATILAALRFYQQQGQGDPSNRTDAIHAIATDSDRLVSLDAAAIDELCQALNTPAA